MLIVASVTDENSSSIFDKGANAILVPSAVFFASKFFNLTNGTAQADATTNLSSFMAGNTTWLQPNATGSPSCLLFTIAIIQNSTAMEQLMTYLLQNATGNKTSWYANVTDYLYLCNLPVALTRIVPFAGCENFSVWQGPGQDPPDESYWDTFQDGCVKLATAFVDASATCWEYVESGQFFEDLCYVYSGEWMMGAAKAVGEKLSDIKEAVVEGLARLGEWIVEKIGAAFEVFVNGVNNVLQPMAESYGNFIGSIACCMEGASSSENTGGTENSSIILEMELYDDFSEFLKVLLVAVAVLVALEVVLVAVALYMMAQSGGIMTLVSDAIYKKFSNIVLFVMLGYLAKSLFTEGRNLLTGEETDLDETFEALLDIGNLEFSGAATLFSIAGIFAEQAKEKSSRSGFYFGLMLAFFGFFLDTAMTATNWTGDKLMYADLAGLGIAALGITIMGGSIYKDKTRKLIDKTAPIVSTAELVLGVGGVIAALFTTYNDADDGWE